MANHGLCVWNGDFRPFVVSNAFAPNHRRRLTMKIPALRPPRGFQFRLGTLLIAIVWVALVSMGLRTASEPWSGILFILSTGSVLLAAPMSIYRTGRIRAFALGFLIF